jgi:hypothetical protein
MIPARVTHNPIIGPGVVPMGVDPAYDAQYARNVKPVAHCGAEGGRPFAVAPGHQTHTQYAPPAPPRPTLLLFTRPPTPSFRRDSSAASGRKEKHTL